MSDRDTDAHTEGSQQGDTFVGDLRDDLSEVRTTADYVDRRGYLTPDVPALVYENRELTWGEVQHESDQLAAGLLDKIGTDSVVFEQLYNCIELYILRLACEKAGIRLLTAPRTFRNNEIAPLFSELRPEMAIVPGDYRGVDYVDLIQDVDPGSVREIVSLDETADTNISSLSADPSEWNLSNTRIGPDDVSQLALTSGSSGTPTCVEVPPAPRIRTGIVQAHRYGITLQDRIGVVTPLVSGAPDAIAYHGAPVVGATVVLFDRFEPANICKRGNDLTVLPAVPTVTAKLLNYIENQTISSVTDWDLSTIINYGDMLSASVGKRAEQMFGCRVQQAFGTADYGGICATSTQQSTETRLRTVGHSLEGNEIALETDDGIVSDRYDDARGNLLVRGAHRVGKPLVGNVDSVGPYFRVGLRATFDDEGRLVLLGRESRMIIRGGRNIYPSEIENALQAHPIISEAAVVGVPDETLGERPHAFVVTTDDSCPEEDDLLAYLRDECKLGVFKLPAHITVLDELPMVPAGHKVDKNALRARAVSGVDWE